ncbi:MAG: hypothetical protein EBU46_17265, partial [Nitrosomonadaceae bacterium]|nr:hypothetical protein [Nitrosomonadaceae bacterium]
MLVQRSVVDRWYQRDSWVYRHFSYLFKNPLWSKSIPAGFSVCPYFWLAMFSMLVFRPTVGFITNVLVPLITLGGAPLKWIDRWIADRIGAPKDTVGLGLLGLVTGGLVLFVLAAAAGWLFNLYTTLAILGTTGQFIFWLFGSGLATVAGVSGYIIKEENNPERCRAEVYLYVWLGLAAVLCPIFAWSDVAGIFAGLSGWVVEAVTAIGWALKISVLWLLGAIWAAVKFLGICGWSAIAYTPVKSLLVPWWVYIGAAGWLANLLATRWLNSRSYDQGYQPPAGTAIDPAEEQRIWRANNRWAWARLIGSCFDGKDTRRVLADWLAYRCAEWEAWKTVLPEIPPSSWCGDHRESTIEGLSYQLVDRLVEQKFASLLDELQNYACIQSFKDWALMRNITDGVAKFERISEQQFKQLQLSETAQELISRVHIELACAGTGSCLVTPPTFNQLFDNKDWVQLFQSCYNQTYKQAIRNAERERVKRARGGLVARLFGGAEPAR